MTRVLMKIVIALCLITIAKTSSDSSCSEDVASAFKYFSAMLKPRYDELESMNIIKALESVAQAIREGGRELKAAIKSIQKHDSAEGCTTETRLTPLNTTAKPCVEPYERVGEDCIHIPLQTKTWNEAKKECQRQGAILAVPSDRRKEEYRLVDTEPYKIHDSTPPLVKFIDRFRDAQELDRINVWIGASYDNGPLRWLTGDVALETQLKDTTAPNDCFDMYVRCAGLYGAWSYDCSKSYYFACQKSD